MHALRAFYCHEKKHCQTDSGWIGPDHPSTATEEWGKEMLETTANYIVDFMEEFKKVKLS